MINISALRKMRKSKHLSQADLAKACGIGRMTYQYLETGKRIPSSRTMMKIADFYQIPVASLYQDETDSEKESAWLKSLADEDLSKLTDEDKKAIVLVIKQLLEARNAKK